MNRMHCMDKDLCKGDRCTCPCLGCLSSFESSARRLRDLEKVFAAASVVARDASPVLLTGVRYAPYAEAGPGAYVVYGAAVEALIKAVEGVSK